MLAMTPPPRGGGIFASLTLVEIPSPIGRGRGEGYPNNWLSFFKQRKIIHRIDPQRFGRVVCLHAAHHLPIGHGHIYQVGQIIFPLGVI